MSPEQAQDQPADERSNMFCFGLILYEILSGRRAFTGESPLATVMALVKDEASPLQTSSSLDKIVRQCLAKQPAERLQKMLQIKTALEKFLEEKVPVSSTGSQPSIAVLPFVNMSGDKEQEYFSDGLAEELINALTQIPRAIRQSITVVLITLLLACSQGQAQSVSYGLSIGLPLNNLATADSSRVAATKLFTFGPSLRVGLQRGFGIDLDLLYKRLDFGLILNPARINTHRLELTPMLRYAFQASSIRPFVHAGMSFNWIVAMCGADACTEDTVDKGNYCIEGKTVFQLRHEHAQGFVLGAGVDFGWGALRLEPELRVTRWVDRNFGTRDSPLRSNLTQIELLLGFLF